MSSELGKLIDFFIKIAYPLRDFESNVYIIGIQNFFNYSETLK